MSKLIASSAHFPKPTQTLLECGAADTLAAFFQELPSLVAQASEPPYNYLSLMSASNLITTAILLCKSQKDLASKWLQIGVLERLLETLPLEQACPRFTEAERLLLSGLDFVSMAVHLACDMCLAARVHTGKSPELASKAAAWGAALLERMQQVFEDPNNRTLLMSETGDVLQTCVDAILGLFDILADGSKGVFDFRPSVERVRTMLKHIPGHGTQRQLFLERLTNHSQTFPAENLGREAARGDGAREPSILIADSPFMTFSALQEALQESPPDIARLVDVITQLATFFAKRRQDEDYCQADLHRQLCLSPLVLPVSEGLENYWRALQRWASTDTGDVLALTTVGQCAGATWASLAAILNDQRFLEVCKRFAEARQLSLDATEDFALCVLAPLRVPRGSSTIAQENAVKEALVREGALGWVFKIAAHAAGPTFHEQLNPLPLLTLCSKLDVQPSAFLTPELLHLFVRQLVGNWRGVKDAVLPHFESNQRILRCHSEEFDRLAGHVRIVEMSSAAAGKTWPGTNFVAFCEGEGVPHFVSIIEERERLQRFRFRAEREGQLSPEAADVTSRVEAVWELVAAAFSLRQCANQACSRAENQRGIFMRCGRCRIARYCSQTCQKTHWKSGHKRDCDVRQ
ncbi:hypothetical protein KFL_004270080 [Klebsormidium nitens]|uniref:phytol kinase n=1 Tax=Klebsormidium nitens TaxID=105231 RepID=A0A1Y1IJV5_KLENI|nr:hypothetical protein KFL_004270080 [Klebsormidium nitens]|eukprot:GAQ88428.1 hypothetical protein KFL_004270080 [Klebsormidium nitens]